MVLIVNSIALFAAGYVGLRVSPFVVFLAAMMSDSPLMNHSEALLLLIFWGVILTPSIATFVITKAILDALINAARHQ